MRFWDSSALVPILLPEPTSRSVESLLTGDRKVALWWGTQVECVSAIQRRRREGTLSQSLLDEARRRLSGLLERADQVPATEPVREQACQLMGNNPLRAADALQLAAALTWCKGNTIGRIFVCLDDRLSEAARREGFTVLPAA